MLEKCLGSRSCSYSVRLVGRTGWSGVSCRAEGRRGVPPPPPPKRMPVLPPPRSMPLLPKSAGWRVEAFTRTLCAAAPCRVPLWPCSVPSSPQHLIGPLLRHFGRQRHLVQIIAVLHGHGLYRECGGGSAGRRSHGWTVGIGGVITLRVPSQSPCATSPANARRRCRLPDSAVPSQTRSDRRETSVQDQHDMMHSIG